MSEKQNSKMTKKAINFKMIKDKMYIYLRVKTVKM